MAERVSAPSGNGDGGDASISESQQTALRSGTYVVQVPKDQVYRVPTPDKAEIAERHRNKPEKQCRWCGCCSCVLAVLVLAVAAAVVLSILLNRKHPQFHVQSLAAVDGKRPDYRMRLQAVNPNGKVDILYGEGGEASLCFRKQEIATGNYPAFLHRHGDTTAFDLLLRGSDVVLPREIERSFANSTAGNRKLQVSLKMKIPARMNLWELKTGSKKLGVACDVMVDALAKGTRLLSQECTTKRL